MKILSMDTSSRTQTVALLDGGRVLAHLQRRVTFEHGSSLLTTCDQVLDEHGWTPKDLDLLVMGLGPGSFTGLRVGMATAKGLARGADIALVGASTLQSMAHRAALAHPGVPVCAAIDARKHELYAGVYTADDTGTLTTLTEEAAYTPTAFQEMIVTTHSTHDHVVLVARQLDKYASELRLPDDHLIRLDDRLAMVDGVSLALLGQHHFEQDGPADLVSLEPHYIRPSDAEIQLQRKNASS